MAFQIQITVDSIEEAERILACLRHDNPPVAQLAASLDGQNSPNGACLVAAAIGAFNNAPIIGTGDGATTEHAVTSTPTKPRGRPRKEPITATEVLAGQEPIAQAAQNAEDETLAPVVAAAEQTPPTFDDAKAALQQLLARHDGDMTVPLQVLASFDAQRISAVKEADWPAFIAACKAA